MLVAYLLLLHEQRVHAGFDQVGDVGASQRVEIEARGEVQVLAVAAKPA